MSVASSDSVSRTLYSCPTVHVYAVPPLAPYSTGYIAAQWTARPPIFKATIHIVETAIISSSSTSSSTPAGENLQTTIRLLDQATSELFAAAPYTHPSVVTSCNDSARFFAVRVQGDGGMKATLGIGFEERSDAFDFKAALGDAERVLGFNNKTATTAGKRAGARREPTKVETKIPNIKEGEMMTVNLGDAGFKGGGGDAVKQAKGNSSADISSFAIEPPPPPATSLEHADPVNVVDASHKSEGGNDEDDDDAFGDFQ